MELRLGDLLQGDELAHLTTTPARAARTEPLPPDLHPKVREALARQGIEQLYVHQAEAWEAARRGENLIVTTGTASGKTLAFNLPVLDALAREPKNRALYLYPTKALAQDQARALGELAVPRVRAAIYDGDTPTERRWQIRKWANLVLTNPDMLHIGVLPRHDLWADVLHNLRYVVVDEAHVYRGVFGSHVANVLRRLRRMARVYGSEPQFLLASATIANPGELAHALLGVEATTIGDDAAPRAERTIALWNPELLDAELGIRASSLGDASRIMAELVQRDLRTICFAKSRKQAELIHRMTADRVSPATAKRLAPYRAGYTPQQRRDIERRLVEGELLGVAATDALELGIDIGLLDCAISVGFPGNDREPAAAVGPRGPPRARARGARRLRGRARPVLHARAGEAARAARRGGDSRPRESARARRPRRVRGVRSSGRRRRPRDTRRRGARAGAARSRPAAHEARLGLGGEGLSRGANAAAVGERRLVHGDRRSDRQRARHRRARARVLDGARGRRLSPPGRAVARARARPRRAPRRRRAAHRRLVHAGEEGHVDRHRAAVAHGAAARARAHVRPRLGDRTRRRVPAQEHPRPVDDCDGRARPAAERLRDRSGVVPARPRASSTASSRCRRSSRRCTRPSTR